MKKIYLFPLLVYSLPTMAMPYVGLEMGQAFPNHDIKLHDRADNLTLSPDSSDLYLSLKAGYVLSKEWAVEVGYQRHQFNESALYSKHVGVASTAHERVQLSTTLESKQFYLAPVYSLSLTNNRMWSLKLKAGISYSQYEFSGNKTAMNNGSHLATLFSHTKSSDDLGLIAGVAVEYKLMPEMGVGVSVKHQTDSYTNLSDLALYANYYF